MTAEEPGQVKQPLITEEQVSDDTFERYDYESFVSERRKRIFSKLMALLKPSQAYRLGKRFAYCFAPQLLRTRIWNDPASKPKQFPTSYLNGLRGITSVKVFTFHFIFAYSDIGFQPWGTNERHRYILELPIVRYLYAGFTAHVFFGIAGYLTTLRLFQLLDKNDTPSREKVFINVAGSLFRRAFRLYLPVFIVTLITTTYIYLGLYEGNRQYIADHDKLFPGEWNEPKPEMHATYWAQLKFWAHEMFDLTNLLTENTVYPWHDQHLWSILAEMRGSLHLYAILIATSQCRRPVRFICMIVMTYMYFLWNHWEIWVYILGAIVAQVDLYLTELEQDVKNTLPSSPRQSNDEKGLLGQYPYISMSKNGYTALRTIGFLVAFYFLSYPIDGSSDYAPGYMTLNQLIPEWMVRKDKFYPNIGTALLLLLLARSDPATSTWRKLLNSDLAQYLGKISFSLYLTHGPWLHAVGYMVPHRIWWMMGVEGRDVGNVTWVAVMLVGWAFSLSVCLCIADVWNREVESRCVKAVKRLEEYCFHRKQS